MDYFYGGVSEAAKAGLAAYQARLAQIKAENPNITHKEAVAMARVRPARVRPARVRKPRASKKKADVVAEAVAAMVAAPKAPKAKKSRMSAEKRARLAVRQLEHPDLKPRSSLRLKDYCAPEKKKVTLLEKKLRVLKDKLRKAPVRKPRAPRKKAVKGMGYGMMF